MSLYGSCNYSHAASATKYLVLKEPKVNITVYSREAGNVVFLKARECTVRFRAVKIKGISL
jgi:hypothetical protein